METFNIQVHQSGIGWDKVPAKQMEFKDRASAVDFCYQLSYFLNKEIRLSTGDLIASNGTYIYNSKD